MLELRQKDRTGLFRVHLAMCGMSIAFFGVDYVLVTREHLAEAFSVRAGFTLLMFLVVVGIRGASEDAKERWRAGLAVGASVMLAWLSTLSGGQNSLYFVVLTAIPLLVAIFTPLRRLRFGVVMIGTIVSGAAVLIVDAADGNRIGTWLLSAVLLCGLAAYASHVALELKRKEEEFNQSRIRDLRQMAGSLAHEFNNQLCVLQNTIVLLKRESDAPALVVQQDVLHQMHELTSNFTAFSDVSPEAKESVCLAELTQSVVDGFAPGTRIQTDSGRTILLCERSAVSRALLNVVKNAVEAGGLLQVTLGSDGESVWVRVEDGGGGFSGEALQRAGEAFFTTKAKGSGLGLAVVRNVVGRHGGKLVVDNPPNGGARVELRFPTDASNARA